MCASRHPCPVQLSSLPAGLIDDKSARFTVHAPRKGLPETDQGRIAVHMPARTKSPSIDHLLPVASVVLLALSVLGRWPYGFYTLLRFVVCGTCAYTSAKEYQHGQIGWTWIMGLTAVLFNPIIPIHLARSVWHTLDLLTVIVFAIWAVTKYRTA